MLICPFCFEIFQDGVLDENLPICRECNAAGRMIEAEPIFSFIERYPKADIEKVQSSWEARKDMWQVESTRILANIQLFLQEYFP